MFEITDETPLLMLPYLAAGQAQKHVTLNESLRRLDAVVQLSLRSRQAAQPPLNPAPGARHLVPQGAGGAWTGKAGQVAAWQDDHWSFYPPQPGWLAWIEDEAHLIAFTGHDWVPALGRLQDLPQLGIGTTADSYNRLSVRAPATLLSHEGNGHQLKLNKAHAAETASLLFQTDWAGHAEIGLAGNDALSIKVSPDGSAWHAAMTVLPDGRIGLGGITSPTTGLHLAGAVRPGQCGVAGLPPAGQAGPGAMLYVPDAPGGPVPAFSDGTAWRRMDNSAVIS